MESSSHSDDESICNSKDTIPPFVKEHFFTNVAPPNLLDYDVLGFDADHCIVKYKIQEFLHLLIRSSLEDFYELGYPAEIMDFNYEDDTQICLNTSLFDIDNGLLLQLAEGQEVIRAVKGFRVLSKDEITSIYGSPPVYSAYQWPNMENLHAEKGKYICFICYFDCYKIPMITQAVHIKEMGLIPDKSYLEIVQDLKKGLIKTYNHFRGDEVISAREFGKYYPAIIKDPSKYIVEQPELRETFLKLKESGKKLFVATNSHVEYSDVILTATFGEDWRSLFDVICCFTCKPRFFQNEQVTPFHEYDSTHITNKGKSITDGNEIEEGKVYLEGNSRTLYKFLQKTCSKEDVKVAYFGDQYITDAYASSTNENWDGFAVVEEML